MQDGSGTTSGDARYDMVSKWVVLRTEVRNTKNKQPDNVNEGEYPSETSRLLGGGELGDGLGSLRDGVLGEFSGKDKSDGSLDFSGRDGGLLVVCGSYCGSQSIRR